MEYIKENDLPFSVAADVLNSGATKCFPVLGYLNLQRRVQNMLLDSYSDSDETSDAVTNQLLLRLNTVGLGLNYVSACTADNASVNHGKHCSVSKTETCSKRHHCC